MQPAIEDRVEDIETQNNAIASALGQIIITVNSYIRRSEKEMRESKEEMRVFREEMQADRQAMNKKWGELVNKMGTLVKDIVAPNLPRIFKDYFGVAFDELDLFALRLQKKHRSDRSKRREFDAVGISDRFVFINETKSKPDRRDIDSFAKVIGEVADYFPEAEGRKIVGIFSALHLPKTIVDHLTRFGIYAMEMRGDIMDSLYFEAVNPDGMK